MTLSYVFIIGTALAMDAFGVALGIGLNPILERRHKIKICIIIFFFSISVYISRWKHGTSI